MEKLLPALLSANPFEAVAKTKDEHLVFEERVWGLKQRENFVFDPQHYGINDFFKVEDFPTDAVMSDTLIRYYSSGRREVVPTKDIIMFQIGKNLWSTKHNCYGKNISWASLDKLLTMFPDDKYLQQLLEKYPYLEENGRFVINLETNEYELAMPIQNSLYAAGNYRNKEKSLGLATLGNLQRYFNGYAQWLNVGIKGKDAKICDELDQKMQEKPINAYFYYKGKCENYSNCTLFAGFTDLSYNIAKAMLEESNKDIKELQKEYLDHGEPLNLTYGLKVFSMENCNNYSSYDPNVGAPSGSFVFSPEVFRYWGQDFSPYELAIITRNREFRYWNPDLVENKTMAKKQSRMITQQMASKKSQNLLSYLIKLFRA